MSIEIRESGDSSLTVYAEISGTFMAESVFRVELVDSGLGGFRFVEEKVSPYLKYEEDCIDGVSGPANWSKCHDVSKWGIFMGFDGKLPVGGATVAIDTPAGMTTPFERENVAALWDLRVHPDYRRRDAHRSLPPLRALPAGDG